MRLKRFIYPVVAEILQVTLTNIVLKYINNKKLKDSQYQKKKQDVTVQEYDSRRKN